MSIKREFEEINGNEYELHKEKIYKIGTGTLIIGTMICFMIGAIVGGFSKDLRDGNCIIKDFSKPKIVNQTNYVWVIPTKAMTDSFCQSKGYDWGTSDSLLCDNKIKCFKTNLDGSLKTDCLEVK